MTLSDHLPKVTGLERSIVLTKAHQNLPKASSDFLPRE